MNLPRSIISLSRVIHPWDTNDRMYYFTGITPHVISLFEIEGIWCDKEDLRDGVVSKMIEGLNGI